MYRILKKRYKDNGVVDVKRGEMDETGLNLYKWVCTQRTRYKKGLMSDYHKIKLEELGVELDPYERNWNLYYKELVKYKEINGNANVSIDYITSNRKALGRWVAHQREQYRKGKLNIKREKKLADLGVQFSLMKSEEEFKKDLLLRYYKENGNVDLPRGFKIDGVNLFEYLQGIKKKHAKDKLSKSEIDFFNELGVIWNKYEHQWEEAYKEAELFYNKNGHLIIPVKKTIRNGINLGVWITTQRSDYKDGKLSSEKVKRLNEIGMCWNTFDYHWKEKYYILCDYYKEHGHINLKSDEKYRGIKLGMWLSTQRQAYRGNPNYSITEERINLLNELGIIWKYK